MVLAHPSGPGGRARRIRRAAAALAGAAALTLGAAACTGSAGGAQGGTGSSSAPVTITFWHGWSQPNELKAIDANIAAFEKLHPTIKVKSVGNMSDDKIDQGLRAGGPNSPDVVSSFTTNNVGKFCSSGAWIDLAPFLRKDGVDPASTFPKAMLDYTRYKGDQCSLPLLGDAYGLYYNVDMFKAAGISAPPRTLSQFDADAVKLTKANSSGGYSQLGFMPDFHGYETTFEHYAAQWGPSWFTPAGKSNLAGDPGFARMLAWQKGLIGKLGGFQKLEKERTSFGDEFSSNPFDDGKTAMSMDGEWRVANLTQEHVGFHWATAPFPVPDDQASSYGRGYQTGTIVGISHNSRHQAAAWEFVKYLTTDTDALTGFANAIDNVPSTYAALRSPKLKLPPQFRTFLEVAGDRYSDTTPASPNGGAYLTSAENFGYQVESGKVTDVPAGLRKTDQQIDADLAQAGQ
ncbi:extracellular solute-binding protein [Phaeacidiphilus oryzae]|uniref:extracellular solute-binding protein n=1 Tax=Phaeacidiphilus oryzae TaxID=348818 RepID=UPI00068C8C05|nr:extracellular solute-binding protein [Phaeacidiphilus oryzae]